MSDELNGNGNGRNNHDESTIPIFQQPGSGEGVNGTPPTPSYIIPTNYPSDEDDLSVELERQARETLRVIRETAGDLGTRVRQALQQASDRWEEAGPGAPGESAVTPEVEARARALARRWVERDFLIDPDLADGMRVHSFHTGAIWRVEVRERGERRTIAEATEPYQGQRPPALGPILPPWDYDFLVIPEIESGERRERLADSEVIGACLTCNGTGHRSCATCDGKGFVQCPVCHGRSRIPCRRCRGRGVIPDAVAERRARSSMGYIQVQAERLAADAGERIADFAERLRQDYGVPLPPSDQWVPNLSTTGETIPCPDCVNGTIPCECGNGKRVCATCQGTSAAPCRACGGSGKVVRHRQLVRQFDTRLSERVLPLDDEAMAQHLNEEMVRKGVGELVWEGSLESIPSMPVASVPEAIWASALAFAHDQQQALTTAASTGDGTSAEGERRVISRRMTLSRVPLIRMEYDFAGHAFSVVAVGRSGSERFWAQSFPPRWSRIGRFLKALSRDLQGESLPRRPTVPLSEPGSVSSLEEFRLRREQTRTEADITDTTTTSTDVPTTQQEPQKPQE
ncbi:MAG TPA: hypothetical protein VF510_20970 [Ktedonobacterales bacterium]